MVDQLNDGRDIFPVSLGPIPKRTQAHNLELMYAPLEHVERMSRVRGGICRDSVSE
jgi:hypothetical protein